MVQLWKLVLLCGLLTGTSASLLGNLGGGLDVLDNLKPVADLDVLDNVKSVADLKVLDNVKSVADLNVLDKAKSGFGLNILDKLKTVVGKGLEVVGDTVNTIDNTLQGLLLDLRNGLLPRAEKLISSTLSNLLPSLSLGLKITGSQILNIKADLTADKKGVTFKVPVVLDAVLKTPVVGETLSLKITLDILGETRIVTDPKTGLATLEMSDCSSDPASFQITVLNRKIRVIDNVIDALTGQMDKIISFVVEKEVCPMLRLIVKSLNANAIQNILNKLQAGVSVQIPI